MEVSLVCGGIVLYTEKDKFGRSLVVNSSVRLSEAYLYTVLQKGACYRR